MLAKESARSIRHQRPSLNRLPDVTNGSLRRWPPARSGKVRWAGAVFLAVSALGCSSAASFEKLENQLSSVELQLLELRKDSPSKDDLLELDASLKEQNRSLLRAQTDHGLEIRELAAQVESLEAKLQDTHFRLTQLAQQIAATQQELQGIRTAAEQRRPASSSSGPLSTVDASDPRALYDTAYADYERGSYDLAILAFRQYLETFPDTELADNAAYWIGECYYHQSRFQQAIDQFDRVLTRYERSERVPSALLKKGYAYLELGQRAQGVVQLQNVICEHGGTDEARLARQRLQELGIDVEC